MPGGAGPNPANTNFLTAGGGQLTDGGQGFNYRTTDLKNQMQRGQSHTGAGGAAMTMGGMVASQSNGFHNGQGLDQRSMSKDSHNRQQQFSNRALKNMNVAEGRKSQLSGGSGPSASQAGNTIS